MAITISTGITITDGFTPALRSLTNALNIVTSSIVSMQGQMSKPLDMTAINTARNELANAALSIDQVGLEAQNAATKQASLNNEMSKGEAFASNLASKVKTLLGAYLGFQGIKNLIQGADQSIAVTARLGIMNKGGDSVDDLKDKIFAMSNAVQANFNTTADAVAKLGIQAGDAFSSNDEILAFTDQLNKHIKIAGTEGAAAEGAMIQMVQAMSNGVLRGEELNSVMDGMPTVAKSIEQYFKKMGDNRGIKEIAEQGLITADIVKAALFSAADETDARFKDMGVTFGGVWNIFGNYANRALEGTYQKLGKIANSDAFMNLAKTAGSAVSLVGNGIVFVIDLVSQLITFIKNNASIIQPIFYGLAAAVGVYGASLLLAKAQTMAAVASQFVLKAAMIASTFATQGLTAGFKALNATMALNPVMIIVYAVIALIAIFYAAIAIVNKFCDTNISATGLIFGAFSWLGGVIYDIFVGLWNGLLHIADIMVNLYITVAESIYNAFNGGFTGWIDGVKSIFFNFVNWIYQAIKPLIEIWDYFNNTDIAGKVQGVIDAKMQEGRTDNYKKLPHNVLSEQFSLDYANPNEWAGKGYEVGKKASEAFDLTNVVNDTMNGLVKQVEGNAANYATDDLAQKALNNIDGNTKQIANNTAKNYDTELKYLRELGSREAINRFTTAEIKLDIKNNNNINSEMDIDSVVDAFTTKLKYAMALSAEGVHN